MSRTGSKAVSDGEGFEPSVPCGTHAFQACPIDRSGTHPGQAYDIPAFEERFQLLFCQHPRPSISIGLRHRQKYVPRRVNFSVVKAPIVPCPLFPADNWQLTRTTGPLPSPVARLDQSIKLRLEFDLPLLNNFQLQLVTVQLDRRVMNVALDFAILRLALSERPLQLL
jgi:hypothetical protein